MDALGPVQTNRCHVVILMRIVELRSLERVAQSCLVLRAVLCSSRYLLCCCQMTKSLHLSCLISVPHAFELSLSLLGRSYSSPFVSDIQSMSSVKCRLQIGLPHFTDDNGIVMIVDSFAEMFSGYKFVMQWRGYHGVGSS